MKRIVHIIAIIGTIIFAIGSLNWIASMLGLFGKHFYAEELGTAIANIGLFVLLLVVTILTKKKVDDK